MSIIYEMAVVEARYLPDKLFYELIRVFKPKDGGYELFTYREGLSNEYRKEIMEWIEKRAKESGVEIPKGSAVLLSFLYGYETYGKQKPERWENEQDES